MRSSTSTSNRRRLIRSIIETLEGRTLLSAPVSVTTNHQGGGNTGANSNETVLTPTNVNSSAFGKKFTATLDGQLYAQVLFEPNVNITTGSSQGIHDVLYAATMHDSLYAIDANTGAILWHDTFLNISNPTNLTATAGVSTVPVKSGDNAIIATVLGPELGILSTPVIDASANDIFLETNTQEFRNGTTPVATFTANSGEDIHYMQRLWAINLSDGSVAVTPTHNPPSNIEPTTGGQIIGDTIYNPTGNNTVPTFNAYNGYQYVAGPYVKGSGDNGDYVPNSGDNAPADGWAVNSKDATSPWGSQSKTPMQTGYIAFNAIIEMNRVALTEINGTIYIGFASHGDDGPYYGWLLGYNASSLANTVAFVTAPTFEDFSVVSGNRAAFDSQAGIWASGGSITTDGTYLYFTTGNGAFDPGSANFNNTYTTTDHGNTVQLPLDDDYGDAVMKLAIDPNATQSSMNLDTATLHNADGTYDPDGGYNANGFGLKVVDYFVPSNELYMNLQDEDLNAGAVLLIPNSVTSNVPGHVGDPMLVAAGKEGRVYLVDQYNLGGFNYNYPSNYNATTGNPVLGPDPSTYDRVLGEYYYYETLHPTTTSGNETYRAYSTPSFFNGEFYIGLSGGPELGFNPSTFSTGTVPPGSGVFPTPAFTSSTSFGGSGTTAAISSNGTTNGVVWNITVSGSSSDALLAYNAASSGTVSPIFSTPSSGSASLTAGVSGATGVKFSVPTVANGMVFVGTGGGTGTGGHILGTVVGFGLLTPTLTAPSNLNANVTTSTNIHLTWNRNSGNTESVEKIERSTDGGNSWSIIAYVSGQTTSYDDTVAANSGTYSYRVSAIYASASSAASNVASATVAALSVSSSNFAWQGPSPQNVSFTFNQAVDPAALQAALQVTNNTTSTTLSSTQLQVSFDSGSNTATVTFPSFPNGGALPNGNYTATVPAGFASTAGGTLTSDYSFNFFFVNGDTDHSGKVDVTDLGTIATDWQQPSAGLYQFGDLNYDGTVNVSDLGILASNWQAGVSTSAPRLAPPQPAPPSRTPARGASTPGGTASSASSLVDSATKRDNSTVSLR